MLPLDLILHFDVYLTSLIQQYGILVYALAFLIIFVETGIVIFPFLPGDTLIFVAGALAAAGSMDLALLFLVFASAAILGDTVNYYIGNRLGRKAFTMNIKYLKKEYLQKTETFYEKHGNMTIAIARFMPIVRTFAPFVAGIGKMEYKRFIVYNVLGAIVWVTAFLTAGYYFGNIPIIRENLGIVMIIIAVVSVVAGILKFRNE